MDIIEEIFEGNLSDDEIERTLIKADGLLKKSDAFTITACINGAYHSITMNIGDIPLIDLMSYYNLSIRNATTRISELLNELTEEDE